MGKSRASFKLLVVALCIPASAWAYRPFESTDAAVANPHEVELELGYFGLKHAHGSNTYIVPQLVVNYGFIREWELVGELQLAKPSGGDFKPVDPAVSLKTILKQGVLQGRDGLSVATEAEALLPSGTDGERRFGFEGTGIVSGRIASLTYHLNGGAGVERSESNPFVLWGIITELPLQPWFRLVSEINGETIEHERPDNSGLLGFIWEPDGADLALDAGFRKGFSEGAVDWAVTMGLTYSFPLPLFQ